MTEINYEKWAFDMCTLLDRIEHINNDHDIALLCQERFKLAEKHGIEVTFHGKTSGLDQ